MKEKVDIPSRHQAAALLTRLLQDGLTNYQLEDAWPKQKKDTFVDMLAEILWPSYDDFPEKPIEVESFSPEFRAALERCHKFLMTETHTPPPPDEKNQHHWPFAEGTV